MFLFFLKKKTAYEIAAHFTAAREISGDFYDWYLPRPNVVSITLGDVMGKGLPAALMMATARAALRGSAGAEDMSLGIKLAADVMAAAFEGNHAYATVFHCELDSKTGALRYLAAGHV